MRISLSSDVPKTNLKQMQNQKIIQLNYALTYALYYSAKRKMIRGKKGKFNETDQIEVWGMVVYIWFPE